MKGVDKLNEICKVSAIQATESLSSFLKTPLGVDMQPVEVKQINKLNIFTKSDEEIVNIYLPIIGDLSGACFFLFTKKEAFSLCDILFKRPAGETKEFKEEEISALCEVTNIVIGNFLTPFAHALQMSFLMHRSAVFECSLFNISFKNRMPGFSAQQEAVIVEILFGFAHANIKGEVLIIFEENRMQSLLLDLEKMSGE